MSFLEFRQLRKTYDKKNVVVKDIDLSIDEGEFVVFLGPSGCGKTTIIRMIAGIEDVTGGDILVNNESIINKPPKDRNLSMIFQSYAVWPHMTVYNNIAYPLKLRKMKKDEIDKIVKEVSESTQLTEYLSRYPSQLSGGQRQRVAVARAIAVKPKIFLMDEPLSNLDAKLRVSMRSDLKNIHMNLGTTSIFVTHDQSEALSLADKIVVLKDGNIEQVGTAYDVYHNSASLFVASFIGSPPMNFFDAVINDTDGKLCVKVGDLSFDLLKPREEIKQYGGKNVKMGVRPENILVDFTKSKGKKYFCEAKIGIVEPQGSFQIIICRVGDINIKIAVNDLRQLEIGQTIYLSFDEKNMAFFDCDTEKRIYNIEK